MYKVTCTFPRCLVTFPACTMTFTQATALESKLVFSKKYRVGIDETRSQRSGGQAQFDRLLFNALFGKHTASIGSYINYIQPMSNITNFYWLRFRGNCAIRNSYDGSRKFSTSKWAAVTKPDWWGLRSRRNYSLWHLVISFVCVCIMFLIISILLILFPS